MLTVSLILKAYKAGVFPMSDARDDDDIFWLRPNIRGIFPMDHFHIPKSFKRQIKKSSWYVTVNQNFNDVIYQCAEMRAKNRENTWINEKIEYIFIELHQQGYAHSFETRDENGTLIGGMYGLAINGAFFGESMYSSCSGASKFALTACYYHLLERQFTVFDTQFSNPHLKFFGCIDISCKDYDVLLKQAIKQDVHFLKPPPAQKIILGHYL